jgi:beta-glucosidase
MARDARWGRMEGAGEDPYLEVNVPPQGFQEMIWPDHYFMPNILLVMVLAESGRDYNTVDVSENTLQKYHFLLLKQRLMLAYCLHMNSFHELNGIPATGNAFTEGYFKERVEF